MDIIITTEEKLQEIVGKAVNTALQNQPKLKVEPDAKLTSIKALANFIGCSTVRAQQLKNSGKIRFYQDGRKVLFIPSEILEDLSVVKSKKK